MPRGETIEEPSPWQALMHYAFPAICAELTFPLPQTHTGERDLAPPAAEIGLISDLTSRASQGTQVALIHLTLMIICAPTVTKLHAKPTSP